MKSELVDYLIKYPGIVGYAMKTLMYCILVFGHNSEVSLEVYQDSEINHAYLIVYIRQNPYDKDIMDKIDSINGFLSNSLQISVANNIRVATDFNYPNSKSIKDSDRLVYFKKEEKMVD